MQVKGKTVLFLLGEDGGKDLVFPAIQGGQGLRKLIPAPVPAAF